jgi:hypothetical protein
VSVLYGLYYVDDELVEALKSIDIITSTKGPSRGMTYRELANVTMKMGFHLAHQAGMITISNDDDGQILYIDDKTMGNDQEFSFYFRGYCPEIMNPILQELSTLCGRLMVIEHADFEPEFVTD